MKIMDPKKNSLKRTDKSNAMVGDRWNTDITTGESTPWHPRKIEKWMNEPMPDKPEFDVIIGGPKLPEQLAGRVDSNPALALVGDLVALRRERERKARS